MFLKPCFKLLFLFFSISVASQSYFEGEVVMAIKYTSINDNISEKILAQEFGDTLIGYTQESRYVMHMNSRGAIGKSKMLLFLDKGYGLMEIEKSDTIYKFKLDKEPGELVNFKHHPEIKKVILGDSCPSITVKFKGKDEDYFQYEEGTYFYNPKYKLNKAYYKNYKNNYWNLIIGESGAMCVRNENLVFPLWRAESEAISIVEKEIPDAFFEPNPDKVIIEADF